MAFNWEQANRKERMFERGWELAETRGCGCGPGNNVSATMRGLNNAHDKMIQRVGASINAHFKARRKAKRAARIARLQAMARLQKHTRG